MNIKHLYYFYIFAQELSTKNAAQRLQISAPALSNQLKQFEQSFKYPLIKKVQQRNVITDEGKQILFYANRMFALYEELLERSHPKKANQPAPMAIGISLKLCPGFSFDFLTQTLLPELFDSASMTFSFESSELLLKSFREGSYDVIVGSFAPDSIDGKWVTQSLHFPVKMMMPNGFSKAIGSMSGRPLNAEITRLIEYANQKNVALALPRAPSKLRDEVDRFLLNSRIVPKKIINCDDVGTTEQLVERNLAVGFFVAARPEKKLTASSYRIYGPENGFWSHQVSVLMRKKKERLLSAQI